MDEHSPGLGKFATGREFGIFGKTSAGQASSRVEDGGLREIKKQCTGCQKM